MRYNKQRSVIAVIVGVVLLVPAIIWSGMRQGNQRVAVKMPDVSTVGPEMKPYILTASEREKLRSPVTVPTAAMDLSSFAMVANPEAGTSQGTGMTHAELDKLAQRRNAPRQKELYMPNKSKPFATIENIPRAPGIEGLTPQERAKLEAHLESLKK